MPLPTTWKDAGLYTSDRQNVGIVWSQAGVVLGELCDFSVFP